MGHVRRIKPRFCRLRNGSLGALERLILGASEVVEDIVVDVGVLAKILGMRRESALRWMWKVKSGDR